MWDDWYAIEQAQARAQAEAEARQRDLVERRRQRDIAAAVAAERRARLEVWDGGPGATPVERPVPVRACTDDCLARLWEACGGRPSDELINQLIEEHRIQETEHE
jgi:hypothetical protein